MKKIRLYENFNLDEKNLKRKLLNIIDKFIELEEFIEKDKIYIVINFGIYTIDSENEFLSREHNFLYYDIKKGNIEGDFDSILQIMDRNKKLKIYAEWILGIPAPNGKIQTKNIFQIMENFNIGLDRSPNFNFKLTMNEDTNRNIHWLNFKIYEK